MRDWSLCDARLKPGSSPFVDVFNFDPSIEFWRIDKTYRCQYLCLLRWALFWTAVGRLVVWAAVPETWESAASVADEQLMLAQIEKDQLPTNCCAFGPHRGQGSRAGAVKTVTACTEVLRATLQGVRCWNRRLRLMQSCRVSRIHMCWLTDTCLLCLHRFSSSACVSWTDTHTIITQTRIGVRNYIQSHIQWHTVYI